METGRADVQGDELPPGSVLCGGQYTIDQYLNAGGFGVTYLARDSLGRRVVVKECFPSALCFRANQTVRVRSQGSAVEFDTILELFEKEARALASLQHPFIVGVHQYFRDNDTAYMAMDFVEGRTLLDILETDPDRLTPDVVKNLLTQLLQAVGFIHRHDILHRDISPDNILIDDDNLPVLIDFGAAREDATRVSRVLSKVLTVKDGYSPQEFYLMGSDQVYASDLYALAATFYQVVSGTAPASSQSRMAAAVRNAADPLAPLGHVPGYDTAFVGAINTCLNLFPKDRLRTAEAWQEAIDAQLRQAKLLRQAEMDRNIDRTIAQLVKDFFKDFKPIIQEPKDSTDNQEGKPAMPAPGPRTRTAPAPVYGPPERPDMPSLPPRPSKLAVTRPKVNGPCDHVRPSSDASPSGAGPAVAPCPQPALQPIDRIRLKYMKPPEPDEPEPAPVGWLGRFGPRRRNDSVTGPSILRKQEPS